VVAQLLDRLGAQGDGGVIDTIEGMVAAKAGIGPGMKVIAVNRRQFSPEVLRDALKAGRNRSEPLELLVENTEYYKPTSSTIRVEKNILICPR